MGVGVYGGRDFFGKDNVYSLEWKSEVVMDDDSGDDEGEEDWLRQGWRNETKSLFQRQGRMQGDHDGVSEHQSAEM